MQLYGDLKERGLEILAFPCNQFGKQEPGSAAEIREFVSKYGVDFPMFAKIDVNGDGAHPMWKWLKTKQSGFMGFNGIKWNFSKFLINREGVPIKRYSPRTSPSAIRKDIEAAL